MFLYSARDISSRGFGEGVMRNLEPSRKVTPSQGFKSERIHVFRIFTFLQKWLKGFGPPHLFRQFKKCDCFLQF